MFAVKSIEGTCNHAPHFGSQFEHAQPSTYRTVRRREQFQPPLSRHTRCRSSKCRPMCRSPTRPSSAAMGSSLAMRRGKMGQWTKRRLPSRVSGHQAMLVRQLQSYALHHLLTILQFCLASRTTSLLLRRKAPPPLQKPVAAQLPAIPPHPPHLPLLVMRSLLAPHKHPTLLRSARSLV